jgi:hypothetical protein
MRIWITPRSWRVQGVVSTAAVNSSEESLPWLIREERTLRNISGARARPESTLELA